MMTDSPKLFHRYCGLSAADLREVHDRLMTANATGRGSVRVPVLYGDALREHLAAIEWLLVRLIP